MEIYVVVLCYWRICNIFEGYYLKTSNDCCLIVIVTYSIILHNLDVINWCNLYNRLYWGLEYDIGNRNALLKEIL